MEFYGPIVIIILSLLCSAFFSGMEIAFLSANRLKIEVESKEGAFVARRLSKFFQNPSLFIGGMLVGNNIALVIYGIYMGEFIITTFHLMNHFGSVSSLLIQTVISTLVILVTAEFVPKTIFRINPNFWLKIFVVPLSLLYYILFLPASFITWLSKVILKLFLGAKVESKPMQFGKVDLDQYLQEIYDAQEAFEARDHEIQIMQNALEFETVKVRDCMVPRNEIVALELETSIDELKSTFESTGLSKVLIYRDSIDNIIGYTHSYEMFKNPETIKSILLPIGVVPEPMLANEVLELLITKKRNIALVVDEFGGTSGVITVEDVVEQIFGEIEDEFDNENLTEIVINKSEYIFSGRQEINYLNEKYKLNLPESDEYDTLAGLVINTEANIPIEGDVIHHNQFTFNIRKVSSTRIQEIRLQINPEQEAF